MLRRNQYFNLFFLAPLCLIIYFSYLWRDYQLDDALIYLRYIKNFQAGHGLVYNPGEKFNGLTSPLFTYIVISASTVVKNLQFISVGISAVFLILTAYFSAGLFTKSLLGKILTAVTVSCFGYFYSTIGMETTLFLFLIVVSLYLYQRDSQFFLVALALLVITRSEGIFLAAPMLIDYVLRKRTLPDVRFLAVCSLIFLAPFIFNKAYYGDFLPATGNAKIGQGKSGFWGQGWIFFQASYLLNYFSSSKYVAAGLLLFASFGAFVLQKEKLAIISFAFIASLLAFYGLLNIPNYHWYYAPFFLYSLLFACHAAERIILQMWRGEWVSEQGFTIVVFFLLLSIFIRKTLPLNFGGRHDVYGRNSEAYAKIGLWLKENTSANSSVAMVEIGTVGWYADRHIVDILGLTNKFNAEFIAQGDAFSWLSKYQPDYILRHDPTWVHEVATHGLEDSGAYKRVGNFVFPGYVLLEKSSSYTNEQVSKLSSAYREKQLILSNMAKNQPLGLQNVKVEGEMLFAHAPSTTSLLVPQFAKIISFTYGVKEEVQGKQQGVCFRIGLEAGPEVFRDCIDTGADRTSMKRVKTVSVSEYADKKLIFETSCLKSCDYAWSYWADFSIE
jgi:arabinofuranosyltransferase